MIVFLWSCSEVKTTRSQPRLYPEVRGVIEALKEAGIPMAVASRTPSPNIATVFLGKLELTSFFTQQVRFSYKVLMLVAFFSVPCLALSRWGSNNFLSLRCCTLSFCQFCSLSLLPSPLFLIDLLPRNLSPGGGCRDNHESFFFDFFLNLTLKESEYEGLVNECGLAKESCTHPWQSCRGRQLGSSTVVHLQLMKLARCNFLT